MTIPEILIWEATNILLLIPVVIALVILTRWIRGLPLFTERDWLFLFGQTRERVLSFHFWLKFAVLGFIVLLIGFGEGYLLLPVGLAAFFGIIFLTAFLFGVLRRSGYVDEWANSPVAISHLQS